MRFETTTINASNIRVNDAIGVAVLQVLCVGAGMGEGGGGALVVDELRFTKSFQILSPPSGFLFSLRQTTIGVARSSHVVSLLRQ